MALKVNKERYKAKWDELKYQLKNDLITKAEYNKKLREFTVTVGEEEPERPGMFKATIPRKNPNIEKKKEPTQADRNKARKETEKELGLERGKKKNIKKDLRAQARESLMDQFDFDPLAMKNKS